MVFCNILPIDDREDRAPDNGGVVRRLPPRLRRARLQASDETGQEDALCCSGYRPAGRLLQAQGTERLFERLFAFSAVSSARWPTYSHHSFDSAQFCGFGTRRIAEQQSGGL